MLNGFKLHRRSQAARAGDAPAPQRFEKGKSSTPKAHPHDPKRLPPKPCRCEREKADGRPCDPTRSPNVGPEKILDLVHFHRCLSGGRFGISTQNLDVRFFGTMFDAPSIV
jgi:hypothetical protein